MIKYIRSSKSLHGLLLGSVAFGLAVPVQASEDIQARLDSLQHEIEQLKNQQAAQPAPANAVIGGDFPGSFKLPGTDTSIAIGGQIKADVIGDLDHDVGDTFAVSAIPGDVGQGTTGSTKFHARQSRVNFDIRTPTAFGEARAFVEADFFGGGGNEVFSNSSAMRIRHAFGELGPVLAGQTWTVFMPLASYPDTVDFFGPQGIAFVRQAQLRYTQDLGAGFTVAGSIENPELTGQTFDGDGFFDGNILGSRSSGDVRFGIDKLPDFAGAIEYNQDGWHFKFAGIARYLSVEDVPLPDGSTADDSEFGFGLLAGAVVPVAPTTALNLNFTYGDGIGRYMVGGFGQDAFLDENGNLNSIESWGFAGSLRHGWTDELASNLVYGRQEIRDTFFDDATDTLQSFHVNTWWSPIDTGRFGLEFMHGRRDFQDGSLDNTANRIQFGAQWFF